MSHLRCECENSRTIIILKRNIGENFCNGMSLSQNKSDVILHVWAWQNEKRLHLT